jgi:hypothetical protein
LLFAFKMDPSGKGGFQHISCTWWLNARCWGLLTLTLPMSALACASARWWRTVSSAEHACNFTYPSFALRDPIQCAGAQHQVTKRCLSTTHHCAAERKGMHTTSQSSLTARYCTHSACPPTHPLSRLLPPCPSKCPCLLQHHESTVRLRDEPHHHPERIQEVLNGSSTHSSAG